MKQNLFPKRATYSGLQLDFVLRWPARRDYPRKLGVPTVLSSVALLCSRGNCVWKSSDFAGSKSDIWSFRGNCAHTLIWLGATCGSTRTKYCYILDKEALKYKDKLSFVFKLSGFALDSPAISFCNFLNRAVYGNWSCCILWLDHLLQETTITEYFLLCNVISHHWQRPIK